MSIPSEPPVSEAAKDLIRNLLCNAENRLDFEQIRQHRFFKGIKWEMLQSITSPVVPVVSSETDTSNFDEFEDTGREEIEFANTAAVDVADVAFMGFSYNRRARSTSFNNQTDVTKIISE